MNILLVEDDRRTAELIQELLACEHVVEHVASGEEALARIRQDDVDLLVLDIMLPGRDGYSICREIRSFSSIPVLMLSARRAPEDRVDGLRIGADDYLGKPFHAQELLARIEAVSRRGHPPRANDASLRPRVSGLELDPGSRTVRVFGKEIGVTATEFDVLRVLVERAGRVVPRERLMELARGAEFAAFDRSVDVHISNIRKKLGDNPAAPRWIRTVRGVGYQVALTGEDS